VHGISLKIQEEERERRDNYCPEVSEVRTEGIDVDKTTLEMLKSIGMDKIPGLVLPVAQEEQRPRAAPSKRPYKPRK
jgi:small subunit ribosomal protein S17e